MKLWIILTACSLSFCALGQDSLPRNRLLIKTDLVSYLPNIIFNTGMANLEVERPMAGRNSLLLQLGYIYSYGEARTGLLSINQKQAQGFRAGVEYRHYFNRPRVIEPLCLLVWPLVFQLHSERSANSGLYIGGQAWYKHTVSEIYEDYSDLNQSTFTVTRLNPALQFRVGFQSISARRLVLDQSLGLGVQYIECLSSGSPDPKMTSLFLQDPSQKFFPLITYSFKIGFAL